MLRSGLEIDSEKVETRAQPGALRGLKPPFSQVKVEKKDKQF